MGIPFIYKEECHYAGAMAGNAIKRKVKYTCKSVKLHENQIDITVYFSNRISHLHC